MSPAQDRTTPWQRRFIDEAIASLPPNASTRAKADAMQALVEKLTALREFERWDPRGLESVVLKENYREVERIEGHLLAVSSLQVINFERQPLGLILVSFQCGLNHLYSQALRFVGNLF